MSFSWRRRLASGELQIGGSPAECFEVGDDVVEILSINLATSDTGSQPQTVPPESLTINNGNDINLGLRVFNF